MRSFTINLCEHYPFLQGGELSCLLIEKLWDGEMNEGWQRPAIIVVPGGAYCMASNREGEPVAASFFGRGFQTFVLDYLCQPQGARYPEQLLELSSAVDYVRTHAKELHVNPDEIFVVGFSAGGHLTGNLAIEYADASKKAGVALDCKPTAVGLCYPVVSYKHGNVGSYENLLEGYSGEEKEELYKKLNLNEAVTKDTPPAFLWTTATDSVVPADNALRYALALSEQGVSYELHVYPRCEHGASTGNLDINFENPDLKRITPWVDDCAAFFRLFTTEKF